MRSLRAASAIPRAGVPALACALACALPCAAAAPSSGFASGALASGAFASGYAERSVGTPEQVAWVRRAAGNFVGAELAGDGAGACGVLVARLRAASHGRTCAQRWDAKLADLLRHGANTSRLREDRRAIPSARVVVHGDLATIALPWQLLHGHSRFRWTENCWMLES